MAQPDTQVGVRFDSAVPGGINLGGLCPEGHGFFCSNAQLAREGTPDRGADPNAHGVMTALFEFIGATAEAGPLVVFLKVRRCCKGLMLLRLAACSPGAWLICCLTSLRLAGSRSACFGLSSKLRLSA